MRSKEQRNRKQENQAYLSLRVTLTVQCLRSSSSLASSFESVSSYSQLPHQTPCHIRTHMHGAPNNWPGPSPPALLLLQALRPRRGVSRVREAHSKTGVMAGHFSTIKPWTPEACLTWCSLPLHRPAPTTSYCGNWHGGVAML
jgi:hypothetical protein